jgi:hypothetical protein
VPGHELCGCERLGNISSRPFERLLVEILVHGVAAGEEFALVDGFEVSIDGADGNGKR